MTDVVGFWRLSERHAVVLVYQNGGDMPLTGMLVAVGAQNAEPDCKFDLHAVAEGGKV